MINVTGTVSSGELLSCRQMPIEVTPWAFNHSFGSACFAERGLHCSPHATNRRPALSASATPLSTAVMSSRAPKLVFVLFFALNCILWSQSRYAHIPRYASSPSISRRNLKEGGSLSGLLYVNGADYVDTKEDVSSFATVQHSSTMTFARSAIL